MKNFLIISLIIGAAIFSLTACSSDNETVNTNTTIESSGSYSSTEPPTAIINENLSIADEPTAIQSALAKTEFTFLFNGTIIYLDQNMAEVLDALGEPVGVRQTPSCAFDGYDRIFGFGAINVHTYPVGDEDFVQIISIRDDSITTRNGIRLGDSWDRVLDAYGSDYVQDFSIFTFTKGSTALSFFVDDGTVVEITYALIME